MKIEEVKNILIQMYEEALNCECKDSIYHPIRIVESVKSIIGISPKNPSKELLFFCKDYMSKFSKKDKKNEVKINEVPEVVTFYDLELSLLAQDKEKALKNIHYLACVSDGRQIFEFLLEFSIKHCAESYLLIWSIFRMQLFIGFKNVAESLSVAIEYIFRDSLVKRKSQNMIIEKYFNSYIYDKNTFELFYNLYRIFKENFIRKEKIRPYVKSILLNECEFKDNKRIDIDCLSSQKKKGRRWILDYLSKLPQEFLNAECILKLDAARGCLKIQEDSDDKYKIWTHVNKII